VGGEVFEECVLELKIYRRRNEGGCQGAKGEIRGKARDFHFDFLEDGLTHFTLPVCYS